MRDVTIGLVLSRTVGCWSLLYGYFIFVHCTPLIYRVKFRQISCHFLFQYDTHTHIHTFTVGLGRTNSDDDIVWHIV